MAREAMASAARVSADIEKSREELREYRKTQAEEWRKYREAQAEEWRKYREAREEERREDLAARRELEKTMQKIGITTGRHADNSGRILEQEVAAQVRRDGGIGWMRADDVRANVVHDEGRDCGECDMLVLNGDAAMAVEVKRVLRAEDVRKFVEMLPRIREFFPRLIENRVLYGAMTFALEEKGRKARDQVRKAAADAGILLVHATGKSGLEIVVNPDREKLLAVAP